MNSQIDEEIIRQIDKQRRQIYTSIERGRERRREKEKETKKRKRERGRERE